MPTVRAIARGLACLLVALGAAAPAARASGDPAGIECRFNTGMSAHYRTSPNGATVRRTDVQPTRSGRIEVAPAEWRLVFDTATGRYRIVVVIDRATGNARRVFGTDERMGRAYTPGGGADDGLVREVGVCRWVRAGPGPAES